MSFGGEGNVARTLTADVSVTLRSGWCTSTGVRGQRCADTGRRSRGPGALDPCWRASSAFSACSTLQPIIHTHTHKHLLCVINNSISLERKVCLTPGEQSSKKVCVRNTAYLTMMCDVAAMYGMCVWVWCEAHKKKKIIIIIMCVPKHVVHTVGN